MPILIPLFYVGTLNALFFNISSKYQNSEHAFIQYSVVFQEPIIIDRIENDQVIIEWENLSLSSLPISLFPSAPREGEQFFITGHSSNTGSCKLKHDDPVILQCPEEILYLPIETGWRATQSTPLSIEFSISL